MFIFLYPYRRGKGKKDAGIFTQQEGDTLFTGRFIAKAAWEEVREPRRQRISWTEPMVWSQQQRLVEPVLACVPWLNLLKSRLS